MLTDATPHVLSMIFYVLAVAIIGGAWALVIHYGDKPKETADDRPRDR